MKIAYLSTSKIPSKAANSIHVMRMAKAMAEPGHEVTLFGIRGFPGPEDGENPFEFYGVPQTFELRLLRMRSFRGSSWAYSFRAVAEAKRFRTDLVYGRDLRGCMVAALVGLPTAFEAHDIEPLMRRSQKGVFERLIRSRMFTKLVVISKELGRAIPPVELEKTLINGFGRTLDAEFVPGGLTAAEQKKAGELIKEKYSADAWNYLR